MNNNSLTKLWDKVGMEMSQNYSYYLCFSMARYKRREFIKVLSEVNIGKFGVVLKTDSFEEAFGQEKIVDYLSKRSDRVVSIDISCKIIRNSMRRLRGSILGYVTTNISDMPFRDETVDLIFSSSTYGYLSDIRKGLKEAFRVIKPGGTLIISVNNRNNFLFRVLTKTYCFLGCIPFFGSHSYYLYDMRTILEESGFTVEYQEPIVHIPPLINMVFSSLDNNDSKFSRFMSRTLMNIICKYSDSRSRSKLFTGWYILFKAKKMG